MLARLLGKLMLYFRKQRSTNVSLLSRGTEGSTNQVPNISTTPITAMGCWQSLSFSAVQLKDKNCRKPHCRNEVIDTFRQAHIDMAYSMFLLLSPAEIREILK